VAVDLLDRRLLFVTGKGGVGKTTITLVGEVDAKGNLADFFEIGPTSFKEREVSPGLFAMSMDTEESLKEYLSLQLKIPLVARLGPLARTFDFVANAAPGVKEILTIGKFLWEVRERKYDLVVVDAVATGHITGQLAAPQAIQELVQVGLVRDQTGWMLDLLGDPQQTGVVIVASPEEMPVNETLELAERLPAETVVDLAAVVANRVLPELFARGEEEVFDRLDDPTAEATLRDALGMSIRPILDGAQLAVTLRRTRGVHLARLRAELPAGTPLLYVPYLFQRTHGARATRQVADHLRDELGY
jgi:anion-transporting  ArsA/GET3 family ATPase